MELDYVIPIRFKAPFRMGSGHGRAGLFDHSTILDGRGWAYLPGSAIKGKLRHLCHRLVVTLAKQGNATPLNFAELCPAKTLPTAAEAKQTAQGHPARFCPPLSPCAFCRLFGSPANQGKYRFLDGVLTSEGDSAMDFVTDFGTSESAYLATVQTEPRDQVSLVRSRGVTGRGKLFTAENGARYLSFKAHVKGPPDADVELLLRYAHRCLTHLGADGCTGLGRLEDGGNG